ncbi:unnamed protein product [Debaryomyces fabryi]|nr:unnamed protein product [Debaryomyces fabryi]
MDNAMSSLTMDHSMPGMDHGDMCSMNMIFTWDWENTCIIYKWWHVKSLTDFILSFIAIVLLGMGYEFAKFWFTKWEKGHINLVLGATSNSNSLAITQYKLKRSLFYGFQVGYSFMLMLVFMTYNGWYMIAVVIGAAIGNNIWGSLTEPTESSMACH